jgi:hypothetical protein
VGMR